MAKKKEDAEVKATEKASKKTTAKSTKATKTTKVAKETKTTKTSKAKKALKEEAVETPAEEKKISPEELAGPACRQMLSSIIDWSMDALMFQNILTVSKKMNLSIDKAAAIFDVGTEELITLSKIHTVLSNSPDKKTVLGRYSDRINPMNK